MTYNKRIHMIAGYKDNNPDFPTIEWVDREHSTYSGSKSDYSFGDTRTRLEAKVVSCSKGGWVEVQFTEITFNKNGERRDRVIHHTMSTIEAITLANWLLKSVEQLSPEEIEAEVKKVWDSSGQQLIPAIKMYRGLTGGYSIKESKDAVEAMIKKWKEAT